jgi:hypothetical protein
MAGKVARNGADCCGLVRIHCHPSSDGAKPDRLIPMRDGERNTAQFPDDIASKYPDKSQSDYGDFLVSGHKQGKTESLVP